MPTKLTRVMLLISLTLVSLPGETPAETATLLSPWWATECDSLNPTSGAPVFASFRRFPITIDSIDTAGRTLTFGSRGVSIASERGHAVLKWSEFTRMQVEKVGVAKSAYTLTIITRKGMVLNEPIGVVELLCLRKLETALSEYAPGSEVGSPPPANIRVVPSKGAGTDSPRQ
jgi:hypothetical protein